MLSASQWNWNSKPTSPAWVVDNPSRNLKITNIKPGTLDDTSWIEPVGNLWTKQAQKWIDISDRTLNFDAQPDDYSLLLERWSEMQQRSK